MNAISLPFNRETCQEDSPYVKLVFSNKRHSCKSIFLGLHKDLTKKENTEKYIFVLGHELAHFAFSDHVQFKKALKKSRKGNHIGDTEYIVSCSHLENEADIYALLLYFILTGKDISGFHKSIGELPPHDATGIKLPRILNNKKCASYIYKWYKENLAK